MDLWKSPGVTRRQHPVVTLGKRLFLKAHSKRGYRSIKRLKIIVKKKTLRPCWNTSLVSFTLTLDYFTALQRCAVVFKFLVAKPAWALRNTMWLSAVHMILYFVKTFYNKVLAARSLIRIGHGRRKTKTDNRRWQRAQLLLSLSTAHHPPPTPPLSPSTEPCHRFEKYLLCKLTSCSQNAGRSLQ